MPYKAAVTAKVAMTFAAAKVGTSPVQWAFFCFVWCLAMATSSNCSRFKGLFFVQIVVDKTQLNLDLKASLKILLVASSCWIFYFTVVGFS